MKNNNQTSSTGTSSIVSMVNRPKEAKRTIHRKRNRKDPKPRAAVEFEDITYQMVKDPEHKGSLKPTQQESRTKDEHSVEVIHLDDGKQRLKPLGKATGDERRAACLAFCKCGQLPGQSSIFWKLVLLMMMACGLDLFQRLLTAGVPVVILTGVQAVPPVVTLLLQLVNGPDKHQKKDWSLNCPSVLTLVRPLGSPAPSIDPYQYFGGELKLDYRKKSFWLPPQNMAVAVAPNCPEEIKNIVLKEWPVSIPILCKKAVKGRPIISLNGETLLTPSSQLEQELRQRSDIISGQLRVFSSGLETKNTAGPSV